MTAWVYSDGGRAQAGLPTKANDCVVRAICVAYGLDYLGVAWDLSLSNSGIYRKVWQAYLEQLGWTWHPTMQVGDPSRVRVKDLPDGRLFVMLRSHVCAVIDGVLYDTFDSSKNGEAIVYGYMQA